MNNVVSFFTSRAFVMLFSTIFSVLVVMIILNIITVDNLAAALQLSPEAVTALKLIVERLQEIVHNILDILSRLIAKFLSLVGIDVDSSKVGVNVNQAGQVVPDVGGKSLPSNTSQPLQHIPSDGNAGK